MLLLQEFIKQNPHDWEAQLKSAPYEITIKHEDGLIIFNYDLYNSDLSNPIVKECRGVILREETFDAVCVPFYKFFNYGQEFADKIDWATARVQTKVDGSICKLWYDKVGKLWRISTNGMINADNVKLCSPRIDESMQFSTFGKILALNVGGNTAEQSVELNRISGLLNITITDEFPANANQIEFIIAAKYNKINVENLCAVDPYEFTQKVSCAAKVGQSNVPYSMVILCPTLDQEYTSDMTINVYDSGNNIIRSVTIDDVRFAANTKTMLSGPLFSGTGASITVNTIWQQDIVGSF